MSEIRVDTISEKTSANGVTIDGLTIKDGGIAATDGCTITTADNTYTLILKSTDADANQGPLLSLHRDSGSPADNDTIGGIQFRFEDDAGNVTTGHNSLAQIVDASNGSEDCTLIEALMIGGSAVETVRYTSAGTIFNEQSADLDFRVESNGNANMLFVDGGNDKVGIGTSSPSSVLHIAGDSSTDGGTITLSNADNSNTAFNDILFKTVGDDDSTLREVGSIKCLYDDHAGTNPSGNFLFSTRNDAGTFSEKMRIHSDGVVSATAGVALGVGTANTASNVLDDYEEGTWTPSLAGTWNSNPTSMSGAYRKIGQIVTLSMIWQNGAKSSSTSAHFTSLPFAPSANSTAPVSDTAVDDNGIVLCDTGGRIWTTANSFGSDNNYLTVTYISN
jgi:hypothetical protein